MCGITLSSVFAATAVASTGASIYSGQQAQKAQSKAMKLQNKQEALREARAKREAIREARIAQATVQNAAENQGASGSSAELGGVGSIQSQLNTNLGFLDHMGRLSTGINNQNMQASEWGSYANMFGDVANLATQGAGTEWAQNKTFGNIFKNG
jgi:hypothetical protein